MSSKEEPIIKARAFALGANDYMVKLPDKLEVIARVRYHSRGYINLLERNEAYRALAEKQRELAAEVNRAARYVQSLLPAPLASGPFSINWKFVPSTQLAGDMFGYHWIDKEHFAVYLLDVSGHGVGSALLAVSAANVLSAGGLPGVDPRDPGPVMTKLNEMFQMERQDGKYFTIWYGVYRPAKRPSRIAMPAIRRRSSTPAARFNNWKPTAPQSGWSRNCPTTPERRLWVRERGFSSTATACSRSRSPTARCGSTPTSSNRSCPNWLATAT